MKILNGLGKFISNVLKLVYIRFFNKIYIIIKSEKIHQFKKSYDDYVYSSLIGKVTMTSII